MKKNRRIAAFLGLLILLLSITACSAIDAIKPADTPKQQTPQQSTSSTVNVEPVVVKSTSYDKYAYQCLDKETRVVYDQILNAIEDYDESVRISTLDKDVLSMAYEAVMADNGGLFWVSGYKYDTYKSEDEIVGIDFEPTFTMSESDRDLYQNQIDEICDEWLAGISMDASDYDKAYYVFTTLINNTEYKVGSENNQNIISVFLNGQTVCQGYADAAWYLLDKLGIHSTIITGRANNEPHAWNLVYLEGAYYFMDVTWGNSRYFDLNDNIAKTINYAYMAMTTEEISTTHVAENRFELPECASIACNYYVRNGRYFDSLYVSAIGMTIANAWKNGDLECSIKMANTDLYQQCIDYFIEKEHIGEFCSGINSLTYTLNDDVNVITFMFN